MAETENSPQTEPNCFSFSIWPPTQFPHDAVIQRVIETQSSPSILSERYGTVPVEEVYNTARRIEEEAFTYVGSSSSSDNDSIEILWVYSKDISKRILDTVKARSTATASTETEIRPLESLEDASEQTSSSAPTEEVLSIETES